MTALQTANATLDQAAELNAHLEQSYLSLALVLFEINEKEYWKETGNESFVDYYKNDLGREKSTVSRLLTVGRFLKEKYGGKLPTGNPSYKKLAQSIKRNPEGTPEHILSEALTWNDGDYKAEERENCDHKCPHVLVCSRCWKKME